MIRQTLNPLQAPENLVVLGKTAAGCCDTDETACQYTLVYSVDGSDEMLTFTMQDYLGVVKTLDMSTVEETETAIKSLLTTFIESNGFIVEGSDAINVTIVDNVTITIVLVGEAVIGNGTDTDATVTVAVACVAEGVCDYYFETNGNGASAVAVSFNGTAGTVAAFTGATAAATVKGLLDGFFTTVTSVTVVTNATTVMQQVTVVGAPDDLIYIDGVQGIKSNCRQSYVAS